MLVQQQFDLTPTCSLHVPPTGGARSEQRLLGAGPGANTGTGAPGVADGTGTGDVTGLPVAVGGLVATGEPGVAPGGPALTAKMGLVC